MTNLDILVFERLIPLFKSLSTEIFFFQNIIFDYTYLFLAVFTRDITSSSAADMGLALTYSLSITQVLNFLIRSTAELEVNVSFFLELQIYKKRDAEIYLDYLKVK